MYLPPHPPNTVLNTTCSVHRVQDQNRLKIPLLSINTLSVSVHFQNHHVLVNVHKPLPIEQMSMNLAGFVPNIFDNISMPSIY